MKQVTLVVPGPITTRTGGSIYDRRIAEALQHRGWTVTIAELDPFTHPLAPPLHSAGARFAAIPDRSTVLVDGLASGSMPEIVEREAGRLRFVPIVHMALSTTPGLTPGDAAWLSNLERRALARAQHVVITGLRTKPYARALTGSHGDEQITCIPPGTDRGINTHRPRGKSAPLRLLCVANLTAGKGHDILLNALAGVKQVAWTLACAGSVARDPQTVERLRTIAADHGLESRIDWRGELDAEALAREYKNADMFVLATRRETYGMAVAEAIAHGLPVVSTRTGEIPSIAGGAALLANSGDTADFAAQLIRAMTDHELRHQLAAEASLAANRLPTWDDAAEAMARVLGRVASGD